jgi:5-methylcytosine-specific restriction protein A|tara:strand:+ start:897 stop:1679 length:783 start_codon:yes stop_codon:yes gene_type:complete
MKTKTKKRNKCTLESYSWEIITPSLSIKRMDRSAFLHRGTGIPVDVRRYFSIHDMCKNERRGVSLDYKGNIYNGHFEKINSRTRLFWNTKFSQEIKHRLPNWQKFFSVQKKAPQNTETPRMKFDRQNKSLYKVEFVDPDAIESDLKSEEIEDGSCKKEGAIKYYYGRKYERDLSNRRKAIEIHGSRCIICQFDFEERYGERGEGFTEIHHIRPLSVLGKEIRIDPLKDLVPVCANCHRMIHRRHDDVLDIDTMKKIYRDE